MTAKEYLSEIQRMRRRVESLGRMADELRTEVEGVKAIVYDQDRVQTSPANRMEISMLKLIDCQNKYTRAVANLHAAIQIREKQIARLDNTLFSEVLELRYVHGLTLGRIADILHERHPDKEYNESYVRKLHGWALKAFEKKYPKTFQKGTQRNI